MQYISTFLVKYWRIILEVILTIVAFVLFIVRKKSVKSISEYVLSFLPDILLAAEATGLKGKDKLTYALNACNNKLLDLFPDLDIQKYKNFIIYSIEKMLSTPQKKGS